jgi:signal transduction histidine kinase/CheY-like chemotaxis protein
MPSHTHRLGPPSTEPRNERSVDDEANNLYILREKAAHIAKAARSATIANILAPLLCIPAFGDEVTPLHLNIWLVYMFVVVTVRTWIVYKLEFKSENILDPQRDLKMISFAMGIVGFGWGLGWVLMAPDLEMVNRMIYVYMITAAMVGGMFAYSVNKVTFYAFTLPIMIPSLSTALWSMDIFPWTFSVGLATFYIVVLSISKSFSKTFEDSVRLRFRNERLYQELANERDQSIAANVAKSKFIAVASHDLRQPMHAVNVYLDIVDVDNFPEQDKLLLSKIKNSITSLNSMFDALLNISKLDAHVTPINNRIFSLQELANTLRDLNETRAKNKGLVFKISCLDLNVCGDKLLIQQIVGNLISNAIQYTETGSIEVRLFTQNECLSVEVVDTGCGVDDSEQQRVFDEFYRADRTRSLHDGLGLGLSIVQRLCSLIGASVYLVSKLGEGSKFVVTTPYLVSSNNESIEIVETSLKPLHTSRMLQGKYIGVIEDNPIIIDAYRQTLASEGAYVYVLSESESELDAQLESINRIDCILSDYRLSQSTGDVLIQKIRENYNEEIPAIIVTADTSPSHFNLFAKLNVQVLHKPVSFQEVAQTIQKLVRVNSNMR